jgi:hypothetical protein
MGAEFDGHPNGSGKEINKQRSTRVGPEGALRQSDIACQVNGWKMYREHPGTTPFVESKLSQPSIWITQRMIQPHYREAFSTNHAAAPAFESLYQRGNAERNRNGIKGIKREK